MNAEDELRAVASEVRACEACKLHLSRKNAVPGEGPAASELMFIGEGPGFHENEQGRPFVGAAGKYLDELLAKIGLQPRAGLHRQRGQVPPAGQPGSAAGRDPGLRRIPGAAGGCHPAGSDRDPGPLLDGALLPEHPHQRHPRAGAHGEWPPGGGDVPSGGRAPPAVSAAGDRGGFRPPAGADPSTRRRRRARRSRSRRRSSSTCSRAKGWERNA